MEWVWEIYEKFVHKQLALSDNDDPSQEELLAASDHGRHDPLTLDQGLLQARQIFERRYIQRALRICKSNQAKTARMLNIHRNTLLRFVSDAERAMKVNV